MFLMTEDVPALKFMLRKLAKMVRDLSSGKMVGDEICNFCLVYERGGSCEGKKCNKQVIKFLLEKYNKGEI